MSTRRTSKGEGALPAIQRLILQLTVGLMAIVGTFGATSGFATSVASTAPVSTQVKADVETIAALPEVSLATDTPSIETPKISSVEALVEDYFSDIPVLAQVARCESHFTQFNSDGTIFRGIVNNQDVGVMQINEHYHLKRAESLGFDIYTLKGNLAYARELYKEQGTAPWSASEPCWGKTAAAKADAN